MTESLINFRREAILRADRVVIKIGTRLLADSARIPHLMEQIQKLREKGFHVGQILLTLTGLQDRVQHLSLLNLT